MFEEYQSTKIILDKSFSRYNRNSKIFFYEMMKVMKTNIFFDTRNQTKTEPANYFRIQLGVYKTLSFFSTEFKLLLGASSSTAAAKVVEVEEASVTNSSLYI